MRRQTERATISIAATLGILLLCSFAAAEPSQPPPIQAADPTIVKPREFQPPLKPWGLPEGIVEIQPRPEGAFPPQPRPLRAPALIPRL
jgi:hypothetical protein